MFIKTEIEASREQSQDYWMSRLGIDESHQKFPTRFVFEHCNSDESKAKCIVGDKAKAIRIVGDYKRLFFSSEILHDLVL